MLNRVKLSLVKEEELTCNNTEYGHHNKFKDDQGACYL
jgi:hypothetical protein